MKKTILMLAVILAAVGLLVQGGCKKHFNITGIWDFIITLEGQDFYETYTFVGDRFSGEVFWEGQSLGFYTVSGDQVHFKLEYYDADDDYTVEDFYGNADADDDMSGTVTYTIEGYTPVSGEWIAVR